MVVELGPATARRRTPPSRRRLTIVIALVASMMVTLLARLYYVQLLDPDKPTQSAFSTRDAAVILPAPRGLIVDAMGRPLVTNTSVRQITVSRDTLLQQPDRGRAVLSRLATLLGTSADLLAKQITPCSPKVPAPCSTGEPFAPVTVSKDAPTDVVLAVSERREDFAGVQVQTVSVPSYPYGSLAAHVLGYTAQITEADKKQNPKLYDVDTIGTAGLAEQYDSVLRGVDGKQYVQLNPQGVTVGTGELQPPVQGDTLVTSIDARVQALAEKALREQIMATRKAGKAAPSGSLVITDPQTGRVVAAASYPTYDPALFTGGISNADYARLTSAAAGVPLLNRATAGQYAPGSTFKLISSSSQLEHGQIKLGRRYSCPGTLTIDGRVKTNFDSEPHGSVDLRDALGYSCDTFYYRTAAAEYYADQKRIAEGKQPHEYLQDMARRFGVASSPGLDLPAGEQADGTYADRESRRERWEANKADYCAAAKRGYPDVSDKQQRAYLTLLASENCTDGWRYRAGDNADMAIGQGETTMSPLQIAMAYGAMVNGGRILEPTLGKAVVDASGKVVRTISGKERGTIPLPQSDFDYMAKALNFGRGYAVSGAFNYLDRSYRDLIGGKTGTAEVEGKEDTSLMASWGPVYREDGHVRARFVMVGVIEQAGTGSSAAGPLLKRVWDGIFGAGGEKPVIAGGRPQTTLPTIAPQVKVTGR